MHWSKYNRALKYPQFRWILARPDGTLYVSALMGKAHTPGNALACVAHWRTVNYTILKLRHIELWQLSDQAWKACRHHSKPVIVWTWIPREEVETLLRA